MSAKPTLEETAAAASQRVAYLEKQVALYAARALAAKRIAAAAIQHRRKVDELAAELETL